MWVKLSGIIAPDISGATTFLNSLQPFLESLPYLPPDCFAFVF